MYIIFFPYLDKKVFEAQETVLETSTLSVNDFRYFRFFHFLLQMMWSKKWYYNYLIFLKNTYSINPVDFIDLLTNKNIDLITSNNVK